MTFHDVRVQILDLTAAHGIDEVQQVIFRAVCEELLDLLAVIVVSPSTAFFSASEIPALAMHDLIPLK